jgi:predicted molibdopterin-dependent oxidoreductase YjgC
MVLASELATASVSTRTACPFCGAGCSVLLEDGVAYPPASDPIAHGGLCLRGWSSGELLRSPLRILRPLVRTRGDPATAGNAEDALVLVAERLRAIRDRYGPSSVAILGSARITLEENRLVRRLAAAIGTPNLDSFQRMGAVGAAGLALGALDRAEAITVVGADVAARHPQVGRRLLMAAARGAPVRFVSSRQVQLSALAGELVRCLPGHEAEAAAPLRTGTVTVWSSEPALHGQGAAAARTLAGDGAAFLPDYVNQRALAAAGIAPGDDGLSAYEMLRAAEAGVLRALVVFADDPFEFFPALAARAFARLDLVVAVDAVASRTTDAADVVLPGALLAEKSGTLLPADAAERPLAQVWRAPARSSEGSVAMALIAALGAEGGDAPSVARLPAGPDGPAPDAPSAAYPFVASLDTGTFWLNHALVRATVTAWREVRGPLADFPGGWLGLAADDARALGVRTGTPVRVESDAGAVDLSARVDPRTLPGTVGIPMTAWERVGSALGALALDPSLRIPVFRPRAVRVVRA